jgi:hypothetical protein
MQNHLFLDANELALVRPLPVSCNTDSVIEIWYDNIGEVRRAFQEPRYFEIIRPDELTFGDVDGVWGVVANESTIMEKSGFSGLIKIFMFLKRSDVISPSEFLQRWRDERNRRLMEARAFRSRVGRFVENQVELDPAQSLPGMMTYNLVAEFWFESLSHVGEFAADADVMEATMGAGADYIDSARTVIYVAKEEPASAAWFRRSQAGR